MITETGIQLIMVIDEILGKNFRRIRESKGWSREKTADLGEVTPSYIVGVETGHKSFGKAAQEKWALIFGIDYREFHRPLTDDINPIDLTLDEIELLDLYRQLKAFKMGFSVIAFAKLTLDMQLAVSSEKNNSQ